MRPVRGRQIWRSLIWLRLRRGFPAGHKEITMLLDLLLHSLLQFSTDIWTNRLCDVAKRKRLQKASRDGTEMLIKKCNKRLGRRTIFNIFSLFEGFFLTFFLPLLFFLFVLWLWTLKFRLQYFAVLFLLFLIYFFVYLLVTMLSTYYCWRPVYDGYECLQLLEQNGGFGNNGAQLPLQIHSVQNNAGKSVLV